MSDQLVFTAGDFEVSTWTKGYPMWLTIKYRGQEVVHHAHHKDIKDLIFVLGRLRNQARAEIGENYRHEFD